MTKYIVMNPKTGKAVQNWCFAGKKHIIYCDDPEWAMKHEKEEDAKDTLDYLIKNFPGQQLVVMKITKTVSYTFG